ncbi:hypothetical protein JTB14_000025 [Gonioctena quinquepunctata]|nr:hypothetical protein JTB14_000025 [Gonioctena quinquepunctata]
MISSQIYIVFIVDDGCCKTEGFTIRSEFMPTIYLLKSLLFTTAWLKHYYSSKVKLLHGKLKSRTLPAGP